MDYIFKEFKNIFKKLNFQKMKPREGDTNWNLKIMYLLRSVLKT